MLQGAAGAGDAPAIDKITVRSSAYTYCTRMHSATHMECAQRVVLHRAPYDARKRANRWCSWTTVQQLARCAAREGNAARLQIACPPLLGSPSAGAARLCFAGIGAEEHSRSPSWPTRQQSFQTMRLQQTARWPGVMQSARGDEADHAVSYVTDLIFSLRISLHHRRRCSLARCILFPAQNSARCIPPQHELSESASTERRLCKPHKFAKSGCDCRRGIATCIFAGRFLIDGPTARHTPRAVVTDSTGPVSCCR